MFLILGTIIAVLGVIGGYILSVPWWGLIIIFFATYLLLVLLCIIFAAILVMIVGKKERIVTPKKIFGRLTFYACEAIVSFFRIKIIYEGENLLDNLGGYQFVCNHQSNFDPLITLRLIKNKGLTFIMKEEIMRIILIGRYLYSSGFYPLDRNNNREGLKTILQGVKAIECGRPMGVYIEGTRSHGPDLGEFKTGALKMAYRAETSIVVAVIDNTYHIKKRYPFRKTTVLFKICRVIRYDEYKDLSTKELNAFIRETMQSSLDDARGRYKAINS